MIRTENLTRDDGAALVRTWSDEGYKLRQIETGAVYDEAVDVAPQRYTYAETDEAIDGAISAEEALAVLLGGNEDDEA